ncbi:hypothetical protein WG66_001342 [Moniliophthora roreri]|uniref:Uncharacterized protein n=1 Tax=Moniliophthora roreri TaxID=221103 RepID=A0A0W0FSF8_MONRR|nr:hypothetical protein WG66_001342 [Moniliophthora roreri]
MSFSNNSDFQIGGGEGETTVNIVGRDQHNQNFYGKVIHVPAEKKRTKYDEFRYIISGDIYGVEEVVTRDIRDLWHFPNGPSSACQVKARRMIYSAKIHGKGNANFTVISYGGPDARAAWEKDFVDFSKSQKPDTIQLFGINQSEVPALIFYDKLIPVGNGFKEESVWTSMYLHYVREHEGCESESQLWIDTKRGRICRGPDGPRIRNRTGLLLDEKARLNVPLTMEMLREDISFRYLLTVGARLDRLVLRHAQWWQRSRVPSSDSKMHGLHFDVVYSDTGRMLARIRCPDDLYCGWEPNDTLTDTHHMDGIVRYTFKPGERDAVVLCVKDTPDSMFLLARSWLAQTLCVFDKLSVPLSEKEEPFLVAAPQITLRGSLRRDIDYSSETTIYLFVRLIPPDTWSTASSLKSWLLSNQSHFWSFDEEGQTAIPLDACQRMGLPRLLSTVYVQKLTWPRYIYDVIGKYQTARGFDPKTRDFARSLGLPVLDVVEPKEQKKATEHVDKVESTSFWAATADIPAVAI